MEKLKSAIKNAWPYMEDKMNLPVNNVEAAIPFYETIMGFHLISRSNSPHTSVIFGRDEIQIGLAENGGDPTQEGCFFEVDNIESAFQELKENGLQKETADFGIQKHGEVKWKVFFVVAPDGLCYCFGEKVN